MGIAIFTVSSLFAPLQGLVNFFSPPVPQRVLPARAQVRVPSCSSASARAPLRGANRAPAQRPLRVLRVVEAGTAPAAAGRMLISGRMADVCAELDRLAAAESAHAALH
jgi:hypothetical protein